MLSYLAMQALVMCCCPGQAWEGVVVLSRLCRDR